MKNQKSILLLEDDPIEIKKVVRALEKLEAGHLLASCKNGLEGLDWLNSNHDNLPGIILLDLNMPKMNGFEFLDEIKSDANWKKIPVIVLTTSNHKADKIRSFDKQVAGYMVKPVRYSDFVTMLTTIKAYWDSSELGY